MPRRSKKQRSEYNRAYLLKHGERLRKNDRERYRSHREAILTQKYFYNVARKFGITQVEYDRMVLEQSGCCAVCGLPPMGRCKRLAVDHDHSTGEIRGLLCGKCNRALGLMDDDPDVLESAAAYLREGGVGK